MRQASGNSCVDASALLSTVILLSRVTERSLKEDHSLTTAELDPYLFTDPAIVCNCVNISYHK